MDRVRRIQLIDTHSGGDVSRIVTSGIGLLPGKNVREKMEYLQKHADGLRKLLINEPYGIPEMSVDLIVEPSHPDAVAGYIIMEVMGYPVYSGSNTICTATALLESGIVPMQEGEQEFILESPAGLAHIGAKCHNGRVESITCEGLPSYIAAYKEKIDVKGIGEVTYSLAWSGGFYGLIDATDLGFNLELKEEPDLAATAFKITEAIRKDFRHEHPELGNVGPLPFLHFMGPVSKIAEGRFESPSATYVHPGVICRSPTGTGTSARLALMQYEGLIKPGESLETVSLRNTRFVGTYYGDTKIGGYHGVSNRITGKAQVIARSEIVVDLDEPLVDPTDLELVLDT